MASLPSGHPLDYRWRNPGGIRPEYSTSLREFKHLALERIMLKPTLFSHHLNHYLPPPGVVQFDEKDALVAAELHGAVYDRNGLASTKQ